MAKKPSKGPVKLSSPAAVAVSAEVIPPVKAAPLDSVWTLPGNYEDATKQCRQLIRAVYTSTLMGYWNFGRIACRAGTFCGNQSDACKKIAEELKVTPRLVADMIDFAKKYPEPEQVRQMNLAWSSVRLLLRVQEAPKREELQQEIQERQLSVRETKDLVDKLAGGKKRKEGADSPPAVKPLDARAYADKLLSFWEDVGKRMEAVITDLPAFCTVAMDEHQTPDKEYAHVKSTLKKSFAAQQRAMTLYVGQIEGRLKNVCDVEETPANVAASSAPADVPPGAPAPVAAKD